LLVTFFLGNLGQAVFESNYRYKAQKQLQKKKQLLWLYTHEILNEMWLLLKRFLVY